MNHPGIVLLLGVFILSLIFFAFWPQKGLIALWKRGLLSTRRVLLEDALKYLFDCEYKNKACTLSSIAGNLNISTDRATQLMDRLQTIHLVTIINENFGLTESGRSYALRIVRVHRVWERYLADETSVAQQEWHGEADFKEHQMTLEAADQLASRIGNPVYDPHGDPIPSSSGDIPNYSGISLGKLSRGEVARIVHIEDEPKAIYVQIMALNLYPGMEIYIMDKTDDKIEFAADGTQCILANLFASNITVERIKNIQTPKEKFLSLSTLGTGDLAEIQGISPACRGQQRRRLMDLGFVPGRTISVEFRSATGDPTAYRILGSIIALRKQQADQIYIKKKTENAERA